jgi:pyrroline-5-carboxylate reductase
MTQLPSFDCLTAVPHLAALPCAFVPLQLAESSDVLFVAVKPQYVHSVLSEISVVLTDRHVVVSIAAGVTLDKMLEATGPDAHIVRVMPNTPCLVGETAAAMCLGGKVGSVHSVRVG